MKRSLLGLLVYRLVIVAVVVCFAPRLVNASIDDCIDATCRITTGDGGRGTGCCFERSGGYVYVLTCAHVVGDSSAVKCEFWREGHRSSPLTGRVVRRAKAADAAIVAVPESAFGGVLPKTIPVAPRDYVVRPGQTLTSVGCANGTWSTGWKGHALGYSGRDLYFTPTPANGRSGSAVFDGDGTRIVGLLKARTGDGSKGIATSVQALYAALSGDTSASQTSGGCAGGICPLPFGRRQTDPPGQGQGERAPPWPGFTQSAPVVPAAGNVTISIGDQLKPLVEALKGDSELKRQEVEALVEARKAEAAWYSYQLQEAENVKHQQIIGGIPVEASQAVGQLVQGEFSQAKDTALSEPMLDWGSNALVYLLTGVLGIGGVFGLLIKFGVVFARCR